ncbi:cupin domain-containing protein [Rhizobium leguminosarum]|uniref:cupin domain-containing protein n=1 Tax=Rhizobium leguminosarum TaxID=384 RepID=UPI001C95D160|nr:cupin domain-containing protein [Rhizobium leguminosarum]MBY5401024.1 cupin domain-containing protein [Rhizobium leguminosarum]
MKQVPHLASRRAAGSRPRKYGGWRQHPGQEFIHVLSGDLELHTVHYEPLKLSAGDSILFDADQLHAYVALGDDAEILMMNSVAEVATPSLSEPA